MLCGSCSDFSMIPWVSDYDLEITVDEPETVKFLRKKTLLNKLLLLISPFSNQVVDRKVHFSHLTEFRFNSVHMRGLYKYRYLFRKPEKFIKPDIFTPEYFDHCLKYLLFLEISILFNFIKKENLSYWESGFILQRLKKIQYLASKGKLTTLLKQTGKFIKNHKQHGNLNMSSEFVKNMLSSLLFSYLNEIEDNRNSFDEIEDIDSQLNETEDFSVVYKATFNSLTGGQHSLNYRSEPEFDYYIVPSNNIKAITDLIEKRGCNSKEEKTLRILTKRAFNEIISPNLSPGQSIEFRNINDSDDKITIKNVCSRNREIFSLLLAMLRLKNIECFNHNKQNQSELRLIVEAIPCDINVKKKFLKKHNSIFLRKAIIKRLYCFIFNSI